MIIRDAISSDAEVILNGIAHFTNHLGLIRYGMEFNRDNARPMIGDMIGNPLFVFLLAENGATIHGGIGAVVIPWFCNPDIRVAEELFWWVFPEHRGSSAAIRLEKELEDRVKHMGVTALMMTSVVASSSHEKVERHYLRNGFTDLEHKYIKQMKE